MAAADIQTERSVQDLDEGILHDRTQLTFTMPKWQKCDSFSAFAMFIGGLLIPAAQTHRGSFCWTWCRYTGPPRRERKNQSTSNSLSLRLAQPAVHNHQILRSSELGRMMLQVAGEGGQLRLSHLTPATPSAAWGFGSDLTILGANPRRE